MFSSSRRNTRSFDNRTLFKTRSRTAFLDTTLGRLGLMTGLLLAFGSGLLLQRPAHYHANAVNTRLSQSMEAKALVRPAPAPAAVVPTSAVLSLPHNMPIATPAPIAIAANITPAPANPAAITLQRNFVTVDVPKGASLSATLNKTAPALRQNVLQAFADSADVLKSVQKVEYAAGVSVNAQNKVLRPARVFYVAVLSNGQWHKRYNMGAEGWFNEKGERFATEALRAPVNNGRLTSGFGSRNHPILGGKRMHTGVDYSVPMGSPVYAVYNGTVEFVGQKTGYGNYLQVQHNNTYTTAYAHLRGFARGIHQGQSVTKGTLIGYVGMTGYSTGPHLHYEVLRDGDFINPLQWNAIKTVKQVKNRALLTQAQATVHALKKDPAQRVQYAHLTAVPAF